MNLEERRSTKKIGMLTINLGKVELDKFQQLQVAYDTLSDPARRLEYDVLWASSAAQIPTREVLLQELAAVTAKVLGFTADAKTQDPTALLKTFLQEHLQEAVQQYQQSVHGRQQWGEFQFRFRGSPAPDFTAILRQLLHTEYVSRCKGLLYTALLQEVANWHYIPDPIPGMVAGGTPGKSVSLFGVQLSTTGSLNKSEQT